MASIATSPIDLKTDLEHTVQYVLDTMLRMPVICLPHPPTPRQTAVIHAELHFRGAWRGSLALECEATLAREFTAILMGVSRPGNLNDDVRDAMGELINMIGGNLLPALPEGTEVSIPHVSVGLPAQQDGNHMIYAAFRTELGRFSLVFDHTE